MSAPLSAPSPDSQMKSQARRAQFAAILFLVVNILSIPLFMYVGEQTQAWQALALLGVSLVLIVMSGIGLWLARNSLHVAGARLLIAATVIAGLAGSALIANVGTLVGTAIVFVSLAFATLTLPRSEINRVLILGALAGLGAVALNVLLIAYQLSFPVLESVMPVLVVVLVLGFGVLIVRQFVSYPLSTKLLIAFLGVVALSVGALAFVTERVARTQLTERVGESMSTLANSKASEIGARLGSEIDVLRTLTLNKLIQNQLEAGNGVTTPEPDQLQALIQYWRTADATDALIVGTLENLAADELRKFRLTFPQSVELLMTDRSGIVVAATSRTPEYYYGDAGWWQRAVQQGLYISQPRTEAGDDRARLNIAMPVLKEDTQEVIGVLHATINLRILVEPLVSGRFGQTGRTEIYLPDGQEIEVTLTDTGVWELELETTQLDVNALLQQPMAFAETEHNDTPSLASHALVKGRSEDFIVDRDAIDRLQWRVIVFQHRTEALQTVNASARIMLLVALGTLIAAGTLALFVAQLLARPIVRLTATAAKVTAGDLTAQAPVETDDEIGALATTFNVMTTQLRETLEGLEQRVVDRTKIIATAGEVSRRLSTVLDRQKLAVEVVEQVQKAFGYYHAHIYFFDEKREELVMAGGTGEPGRLLLERGHKIPRSRGLVGRAAETNLPVLVADTSKDPGWLPNPLLPDTKSEIAVPIAVGEHVLGVLDVQHNTINGLGQLDIELLQSLASQVAIAYQNARSYSQAQRQADMEALTNAIAQRIQSADSVEAAMQIAVRELGRALGGVRTRVKLNPNMAEGQDGVSAN